MANKTKPTDANSDLTGETVQVEQQMTPAEIMIELGVPTTQKNQPDLINYQPKRFIQLEEARRRGLSWFFDGSACRYSHVAAHRTSNIHICSDCQRVKKGLEPIYGKSKAQKFYEMKPMATTESNTASTAPTAPAPQSLGLSAADTKFLEHYARERNLEKAAVAAGTTKELILARRVGFPGLDEAMTKLEQQLEIPRYLPPGAHFVWDDEKRKLFIDSYINSGELEIARGAVGCTRSQFAAELKANIVFSHEVEAARELAEGVVEEALFKAAKQGQQSVLPKVAEMLEKRAATRAKHASDPTKARAELTELLDGLRKKRFEFYPSFRVRSTGAIVERKNLEAVLRDATTGVFYKREDLEEIPALVLNARRNAASLADAPTTESRSSNEDLVAGEDDTNGGEAPANQLIEETLT
jgi:hypothetical protein